MATNKLAQRRAHSGDFERDQSQRLGQQVATKANETVDTLAVLNNRGYAALTANTTIGATAYATLLTVAIRTTLVRGYLLITLSASGAQITSIATISFQVVVDGVVAKGLYTTVPVIGYSWSVAMLVRVAVAKGPHVVLLQWKTNAASARINASTVVEEHASLLVQEAA